MRLLIDANLSPRLVEALADLYPESEHVFDSGIERSDTQVWQYARDRGLTILTKDSDFHQRVLVLGHPPKVVLVRLGNCQTRLVEALLRLYYEEVRSFGDDHVKSLLVLP